MNNPSHYFKTVEDFGIFLLVMCIEDVCSEEGKTNDLH